MAGGFPSAIFALKQRKIPNMKFLLRLLDLKINLLYGFQKTITLGEET